MMKRLLIALALAAVSLPAFGQAVVQPAYRILSPSYVQFISNSALATTTAFMAPAVRVVCTVSCWITFRAGNNTVPATIATGHFLTPNAPPEYFQIVRGSTISVIGNTSMGGTGGTIYISEAGH